MKILFDPQVFNLGYSGMYRYYTTLYRGLKEAGVEIVETVTPKLVLKPPYSSAPKSAAGAKFSRFKNRYKFYSVKKKFYRALSEDDYDLLYITAPNFETDFLKYMKKKPFVMTVHDTMKAISGFHTFFDQPRDSGQPGYLAHLAERVVCVSDYTKNDLCAKYQLDPGKARTVYLANFLPQEAADIEHLPENYILFAGARNGRKNFYEWLKAVSPYLSEHPGLYVAVTGAVTETERFFARKFGTEERIVSFENVTDAQLNTLYRNAICLAYPSLYEGFGLPVLEAMANGCPVITSNCTSIPEVAGDAAVLIDPLDSVMMLESLKSVVENESLRKNLAKKGLERSKKFSKNRFIREMTESFEEAIRSYRR